MPVHIRQERKLEMKTGTISQAVVETIASKKIIAILRRYYGEQLQSIAEALYRGGVGLIECTYDQQDSRCISKTAQAIADLTASLEGKVLIGAGTVLTVEQVDAAFEAGAKYIISPNVNEKVIARTKELDLVSIPGAMTPTEILRAHESGADFVKLFPAGTLGLKYAKDILAPISHVKLIATGGITENNFKDYLELGFVGAGISSGLAPKKLVAAGAWAEIEKCAASFCKIAEDT